MSCVYDGKEAIGIDLCHAGHPVCADHAFGHQLAELPEPPKKPAPKKEARVQP